MARDTAHDFRDRATGVAFQEIDPPSLHAHAVAGGEGIASYGVAAGAAIGAVGGLLAGASKGDAARAITGAMVGGLAGVGLGYVAEVRRRYGLSLASFSRAAGISTRTLSEWEKGNVSQERRLRPIHELNRLYHALSQVVEPSEIGPWMERPSLAFDGMKPLELIERGETDRLWRMVYQLESGSPS